MYEFYEETTEFDIQIAEWKDTLKKAVKEEYRERMKELEEENARLRDIKENWDQKVAELEEEKRKLRVTTLEAEAKAKKERLRGLLDCFTKIAWGYKYDYEYIHEKCDKCDEKGYIHYKSPQGRDVKEECDCRKRVLVYRPQEAEIVEFDDYRGKIKPTFEYARSNNLDDYDRYEKTTRVYNGEDFDKIDNYYGMIFFDKGDCQRFCDYMNKKVWDKLTDEVRQSVLDLPNFDPDKFYECTGIKTSDMELKE